MTGCFPLHFQTIIIGRHLFFYVLCLTISGHINPECDLNEMDVNVDMILKKHPSYK